MANAQVHPRQLPVDNPICPKCARPMIIVRILTNLITKSARTSAPSVSLSKA